MATESRVNSTLKLLFILGLAGLCGLAIGFRSVPLGLDLRGGVEWVYEIDIEKLPAHQRAGAVERTINVIRRRVDPDGTLELDIRQQGVNRFYIQLPGVGSEEEASIEKKMQSTGKLLFCLVNENDGDRDRALGGTKVPGYVPYIVTDDTAGTEKQRFRRASPRELARKKPEAGDWLLVTKEPRVIGKDLASAYGTVDDAGAPAVGFEFSGAAREKFEEVTANNIGKKLAIILDDLLYSAPTIQSRISTRGQITGRFTKAEVDDLVVTLRAGKLDTPIHLKWKHTVGPTLGRDSIAAGLRAITMGLALVLAFMAVYYLAAGGVANAALMLNLLFVVGALALIRGVLTLPGIAGLILTVGMAVDANVLIFERIREEKERGKTLRLAVRNGYERAFRTIIDANLTTLITALILFGIGQGPVRGFAVTLSLGILSSMFCALFVTRVAFDLLIAAGVIKRFTMLQALRRPQLKLSRLRHVAQIVSLAAIVTGLAVFVWRGDKKYDTDMVGGTRLSLALNPKLSAKEVRERVMGVYGGVDVQRLDPGDVGDSNAPALYSIRVKHLADKHIQDKIGEDLRRALEGRGKDEEQEQENIYEAVEVTAPWVFELQLTKAQEEGVLRERRLAELAGYRVGDVFELVHMGRADEEFEIHVRQSDTLDKDIDGLRAGLAGDLLVVHEIEISAEGPEREEGYSPDASGRGDWATVKIKITPHRVRKQALLEAVIADILGGEELKAADLRIRGAGKDTDSDEEVREAELSGRAEFIRRISAADGKSLRVLGFERVQRRTGPTAVRIELEIPLTETALREKLGERGLLDRCQAILPVGEAADRYLARMRGEDEDRETLCERLVDKIQAKIKDDLRREFKGDLAITRLNVEFKKLDSDDLPDFIRDLDEDEVGGYKFYQMSIKKEPVTYQIIHDLLKAAGHDKSLVYPGYPGSFSDIAEERTSTVFLKLKGDSTAVKKAQDDIKARFANPDPIRSAETIGAAVSRELRNQAFLAMFIALVAIVFYIWFRFGELKFGIAAIVALAHDVLVAMGAIAVADALSGTPIGKALLFHDIKINVQMIAAFLTIIGYSLNDTIVIFDRIRENMGGVRRKVEPSLTDLSINQTLSRTLLTSVTTLIVVLSLYLFGGPVIHGFAFALTVGVLAGTYSSVFIATPLLIDWESWMARLRRAFRVATFRFR